MNPSHCVIIPLPVLPASPYYMLFIMELSSLSWFAGEQVPVGIQEEGTLRGIRLICPGQKLAQQSCQGEEPVCQQ